LAPLIFLSLSTGPARSFLYGLITGLVFWLTTIFWLTHVTYIGWIGVSVYCALYFGVFVYLVSWWHDFRQIGFAVVAERGPARSAFSTADAGGRSRPTEWIQDRVGQRPLAAPHDLIFLFGIPAIWVSLEYLRAHFLTGFPWNLAGVSQFMNSSLIQCAEWGGVYLVSYLLVMGNTVLALLVRQRFKFTRQTIMIICVFAVIISSAVGYGFWRHGHPLPAGHAMDMAAIQLNVPQAYKWSPEQVEEIYRRLKQSTLKAVKSGPPGLIVWPETALPDLVQDSEPGREIIRTSLEGGVPMLVGTIACEELHPGTNYFNSSFLYLPGQQKPQVYAKRHLVIFGEYVPLGRYFPFLRSIAGVGEDFTPGSKNVVFCMDNDRMKFSVLICFEDTLPYLARDCVRGGARLLINQTNDAWFDPGWASRQHMAHCVFRCIENRVACLRAANTGLTCLINRHGVILSALPPMGRVMREPQIFRVRAEFAPADMPLTFYTRHGDVFALACVAFSLPVFAGYLMNLVFVRRRRTGGSRD
jgi:apolipoprotein N-acyltransferase